jgi:hypothetical protein
VTNIDVVRSHLLRPEQALQFARVIADRLRFSKNFFSKNSSVGEEERFLNSKGDHDGRENHQRHAHPRAAIHSLALGR